MGYRLHMSTEIYDWLAELRVSDPSAAGLATQAPAALADEGDRSAPAGDRCRGRPAVAGRAGAGPGPALSGPAGMDDACAARWPRRRCGGRTSSVSSPSWNRRRLRRAAGRLAAAIEAEKELVAESQREQMRVDAFRTRKEVLKAAYTAAQAEHLIDESPDADGDTVRGRTAGAAVRLTRSSARSNRSWTWSRRPRA